MHFMNNKMMMFIEDLLPLYQKFVNDNLDVVMRYSESDGDVDMILFILIFLFLIQR